MKSRMPGELAVSLREAWIELPEPGDDADAHIDEIVARFELHDRADDERRLGAALRSVLRAAEGLPAGAPRQNNALVLSPTAGRVEALLSLRIHRVTPDAYDNYLAAAQSYEGDGRAEVIEREVEEVRLTTGRAIISHDFLLSRSVEGVVDPALERTFLTLFLDDAAAAAEFTLLTQNLALFRDAREYLTSLAQGEDPPLPGTEDPS